MSARGLAAVAMVAAVLVLTGCGNQGTTSSGSSINTFETTLPDGRTVTCVSVGGSSVSCDWEGARR